MSTSKTAETEEIRSHAFFVAQTRESRHSDNQQLQQLVRRARNGNFTDINELSADLPRRRPPKRHTSEKVRRYGRNRSRLAHWKTKAWKRRSAEAKERAQVYEDLRNHNQEINWA